MEEFDKSLGLSVGISTRPVALLKYVFLTSSAGSLRAVLFPDDLNSSQRRSGLLIVFSVPHMRSLFFKRVFLPTPTSQAQLSTLEKSLFNSINETNSLTKFINFTDLSSVSVQVTPRYPQDCSVSDSQANANYGPLPVTCWIGYIWITNASGSSCPLETFHSPGALSFWLL